MTAEAARDATGLSRRGWDAGLALVRIADREDCDHRDGIVMNSLEERIGFKFRNSLLLAEALTHPSLAYETQKPHFDNQRLEYLGDSVIQLVFSDELFRRYRDHNEGTLTKMRSLLVSRQALARYADRIHLGSYLMMGKGEEASGGRTRASTLADAFEALVGAIYLDAGLDKARAFVLVSCREEYSRVGRRPDETNPKGHLQEVLQAHSNQSPVYAIVSQEGPDHCKTFEAKVEWRGKCLGFGTGNSKKEAEIEAAKAALKSPIVLACLPARQGHSTADTPPVENLSTST